jgi:hypothetical protein
MRKAGILITPTESSTEIAFVRKWNVTDLGRELRQDGKLYSLLAPQQRKDLHGYVNHIDYGFQILTLPVPEDGFTGSSKVRVKKDANGWGLA